MKRNKQLFLLKKLQYIQFNFFHDKIKLTKRIANMKTIFTLIIILFFNFNLYANNGTTKVKLLGNTNTNTPKYVTAEQLSKEFSIQKFHLYNPWEKQTDTYEGILFTELVKKYGNKTKELKFIALDDYTITFAKELYENERILLAFKVNGKYLSIKEKGPMRVVFVDYDPNQKKYELNLEKWLWMIKKIEFK